MRPPDAMVASTFELFKVGVGPSSSHTMGPMTAAADFVAALGGGLAQVARVEVRLYGSLALTGKGHATDTAIILGLCGEVPATVDTDGVPALLARVHGEKTVLLLGRHRAAFDPASDIAFLQRQRQPFHSNAMAMIALDADGGEICRRMYYSIGGGFVLDEDEAGSNSGADAADMALPYDFHSGAELLALGAQTGLTFAELMFANECSRSPAAEAEAGLDRIARPVRAKAKSAAPRPSARRYASSTGRCRS